MGSGWDGIFTMNHYESGIYQITCLKNKKVYIGMTINFKSRNKAHISDLGKNIHCNRTLQEDYNNFGTENFEWSILQRCEEPTRELERKYLIEAINNKKEVYNRTGFSDGGILLSENNITIPFDSDMVLTLEEIKLMYRYKISGLDFRIFLYEKYLQQTASELNPSLVEAELGCHRHSYWRNLKRLKKCGLLQ